MKRFGEKTRAFIAAAWNEVRERPISSAAALILIMGAIAGVATGVIGGGGAEDGSREDVYRPPTTPSPDTPTVTDDEPPPNPDSDGDGVDTPIDKCPNDIPAEDSDGDGCDDPVPCWTDSEGNPNRAYEPNNRRTNAFGEIGARTYHARIGTQNDVDWYALCVGEETELEVGITLTGCDQRDQDDCYELYGNVYGEGSPDPVADGTESQSLDDGELFIRYTAKPGRYFVEVTGLESNEYELQVGPGRSLVKTLPASTG